MALCEDVLTDVCKCGSDNLRRRIASHSDSADDETVTVTVKGRPKNTRILQANKSVFPKMRAPSPKPVAAKIPAVDSHILPTIDYTTTSSGTSQMPGNGIGGIKSKKRLFKPSVATLFATGVKQASKTWAYVVVKIDDAVKAVNDFESLTSVLMGRNGLYPTKKGTGLIVDEASWIVYLAALNKIGNTNFERMPIIVSITVQ